LEGDVVVGHHTAKVLDKINHFKKCQIITLSFETAR
jgi:hypothetical protein